MDASQGGDQLKLSKMNLASAGTLMIKKGVTSLKGTMKAVAEFGSEIVVCEMFENTFKALLDKTTSRADSHSNI